MMKKNKAMRFASGLLAVALLTTCAVSGTFAKYVTTTEGTDSARVAKWGVEVTTSTQSLFASSYTKTDTSASDITNSVQVADGGSEGLVAPGTSTANSLTFSITGKPEVAVKVDPVLTVTGDVHLAAGTYTDYTKTKKNDTSNTQEYGETFKLDNAYYPVKFTLKKSSTKDGDKSAVSYTSSGGSNAKSLEDVSLTEIQAYFQSISSSSSDTTKGKYYDPNTNLSETFGYYELTWKWDFDYGSTTGANDAADTLLGMIAADASTYAKNSEGTALSKATYTNGSHTCSGDYCTDIGFNLKLTVTQVD